MIWSSLQGIGISGLGSGSSTFGVMKYMMDAYYVVQNVMWCLITVWYHIEPGKEVNYTAKSNLNSATTIYLHSHLMLAMGPGNLPAVRVWTAKSGRFGSRPIQRPNPLTLGGPNPNTDPSTRRFHRVWLAPLVPISGCAFQVSHL